MLKERQVISLIVDRKQIDRLNREFAEIPKKAQKALMHSLNRAVSGMRTDAKREIVKRYFVTAKTAANTMSVYKANINKLEASLSSAGTAIPAIKFRTSPGKVTNPKPKGGVKIRVRKDFSGKRIPHTFIAQMNSGHVGVFKRTGSGSLPIKQIYGPAVPSMMKDVNAYNAIRTGADTRLQKALDHEIDRLLKGYGT